MGKHIKTSMDEKVIDYLAIELYKVDPDNVVLNKFMSMKNEEGYALTKTINKFKQVNILIIIIQTVLGKNLMVEYHLNNLNFNAFIYF